MSVDILSIVLPGPPFDLTHGVAVLTDSGWAVEVLVYCPGAAVAAVYLPGPDVASPYCAGSQALEVFE